MSCDIQTVWNHHCFPPPPPKKKTPLKSRSPFTFYLCIWYTFFNVGVRYFVWNSKGTLKIQCKLSSSWIERHDFNRNLKFSECLDFKSSVLKCPQNFSMGEHSCLKFQWIHRLICHQKHNRKFFWNMHFITHWPLEDVVVHVTLKCNLQIHITDQVHEHFLSKCSQVNVTEHIWW